MSAIVEHEMRLSYGQVVICNVQRMVVNFHMQDDVLIKALPA